MLCLTKFPSNEGAETRNRLLKPEKWKWKSLSYVQLFATPWTVVHGILQARILEWVAFPLNPRHPTLQAGSLPAKPLERPKNTGVGRLLFLQWIFNTWELNQGLLHCRQILYQLNYQGSPPKCSALLLVGKSNSGLPRDKGGYSPLYRGVSWKLRRG